MKKLSVLLAALLLSAAISANAAQKLVSFEHAYKGGAIDKSISAIGGKVTKKFELIDVLVAVFPDNVKDASIYSLPGVTNVDEDRYLRWIEAVPSAMAAPQLPSLDQVLGMVRTGEGWEAPVFGDIRADVDPALKEIPWGVKRVNAAAAWDYTAGEGVKVAVIDTGIDYNHPDLAAVFKGGYNAVTPGATAMDDQGHGTHVSGTVAALKDLKGVVGVAPKVDLYVVKVLDKNGSGQYSWIVDGIEWAIKNNIKVINMSLGGRTGTDALAQVMKKAKEAGVTVVCAAGNDSGPVNYPAKYPEAIAVSASDSSDKLASFSSKGAEIVVIAPGVSVYSTKKGGGYTSMSGTSMASPHVAGLAALAVGAGAKTPDEVREALKRAATPLPGLKPTDQGAGMVDAFKLVR
ncbi:MAG: S8 family peptidase [Elusimicrobiales bacterium]|nr:S8 family peptidase [Elusimicrobiales bacterium]